MNRPQRIDLRAALNKKMFESALETLKKADTAGELTEYDSDFYRNQQGAWDMVGTDYSPTVKQFNHLRLIASEATKAGY